MVWSKSVKEIDLATSMMFSYLPNNASKRMGYFQIKRMEYYWPTMVKDCIINEMNIVY